MVVKVHRIPVLVFARACCFVVFLASLIFALPYGCAVMLLGWRIDLTIFLAPFFSALSALVAAAVVAFSYNVLVPRVVSPVVLHMEETHAAD